MFTALKALLSCTAAPLISRLLSRILIRATFSSGKRWRRHKQKGNIREYIYIRTHLIDGKIVAFGDFFVQLFDIGKSADESGRASLRLLAVENQFRFLCRLGHDDLAN